MEWIIPLLTVLALAVWVIRAPKSPPSDVEARPIREPDIPPSSARAAPPTDTIFFRATGVTRDSARPITDIERAAHLFSLACVVTPTRSDIVLVRDPPGSDLIFSVDLLAQTCTCANFALRAHRSKNQFGRWCRHLVRSLNEADGFHGAGEWHQAIADDGYDGPLGALLIHRQTSGDVLVTQGADRDWLNIYARSKRSGETIGTASGPIVRHGWSISQQRWAWGEGPPGARELRQLLKSVRGIDVHEA